MNIAALAGLSLRGFNRRQTRKAINEYRKVGVENVLLLDIDGMAHSNPAAEHFSRAIDFLDSDNASQDGP